MFFYILRRLVAVVIMLIIIEHRRPSSSSSPPRSDPARLTCGKNCTPATIEGNRQGSRATTSRSPCSTQVHQGHLRRAATTPTTPSSRPLPRARRALPGTLPRATRGSTTNPSPTSSRRRCRSPRPSRSPPSCCGSSPASSSASSPPSTEADGRTGCSSARADRLLAADLLHRLAPAVFVAIKWQLVAAPRLHALHRQPGRLGRKASSCPRSPSPPSSRAAYVRLTRAYMLETMSRGLHPHRAREGREARGRSIRRHGLRAALTPIVTAAGLDLGGLLGGAIITETGLHLPGPGLAPPSRR